MSENKLPNFNKLVRTSTASGIELKTVYKPEDVNKEHYEKEVGDPGCYPYTRGIYPEMYRSRLWQKSFIVSYASPEETNEGFRKNLAKGITGCRVTEDLPSQMGLDPDHPLAWNSMMCGGVSAYAKNVFDIELDGLPLENTTYEMGTGGIIDSIYMYCAVAAKLELAGGNIKNLKGSGIATPIRAKLVYGHPSWPTEIDRRVLTDHLEFTQEFTPRWYPFAPNGVDCNQAGANAVHELAFVFAETMAVLDDFIARGHHIDDYKSMVFALDSDSDFFETIAKYRCARRMWAKITKERYGAKKESTMKLKLGLRTSGASLTKNRPLANTARITLQILESVLAGVNAIDACSLDEAIGLPTNEARQFSLDAHNIIAYEANVPQVVDPLGGSYYLEWLTDKLEEETWKVLKDFEERGGTWACLESGYLSSLLEEDRLKQQHEKAEHTKIVVGLNAFDGDEGPINEAILNNAVKTPTVEERLARIEELKAYRASRDQEALAEGLRNLYLVVKDKTQNCNRAMIDAVKAGATVGEFCGVVRMAYGLEFDFSGLTKAPEHVMEALKDVL